MLEVKLFEENASLRAEVERLRGAVDVDRLVRFVDSYIGNAEACVRVDKYNPWSIARAAADKAVRDYFSPAMGAQQNLRTALGAQDSKEAK